MTTLVVEVLGMVRAPQSGTLFMAQIARAEDLLISRTRTAPERIRQITRELASNVITQILRARLKDARETREEHP